MKISNNEILAGEHKVLKLFAGRLPSDTQIPIYVHVYRGKDPGPKILLVGGMHGDEINGVEILRQSIYNQTFEGLIKGTVVVIPLLNIYGFINFSRDLPDGKDVNRSFPGSAKGSLARRVAYKLTHEILEQIDFGIDFHTGGNSRFNFPQIRHSANDQKALELARAFAPPAILEKPMIKGSFRAISHKKNIPIIVYEGGEALRWDGDAIKEGMDGIKRLLKSKGMIKKAPNAPKSSVVIQKSNWLRAQHSGLFTWHKSSGDYINKGDVLGIITDPNGKKLNRVISKTTGLIVGHNNAAVVHTGDALFHVGLG